MKKSKLVITCMVVLVAGIYYISNQMKRNKLPSNRIIAVKDCGNLNCVTFVQEGDTFALDFLTDQELDSLKIELYEFEQRKGNAGSIER